VIQYLVSLMLVVLELMLPVELLHLKVFMVLDVLVIRSMT